MTIYRSFNALAESVNGLYKAECVYGPDANGWDDTEQLELATLTWVHWFNHQRLHSHCGHIPPAEFEHNHQSNTSSIHHPNDMMESTTQTRDTKPIT